ncbi:hypothetical protein ACROYT_G016976, partial [Oculina patagonica]
SISRCLSNILFPTKYRQVCSFAAFFTLAVVLLLSSRQISARNSQQSEQFRRNTTNIILIGATGDLAKRYLWQGFFRLFIQETSDGNTFRFYPTARENFESGQKKIDDILEESLKCSENEHLCANMKKTFQKKSVQQYHRLKEEQDYISLCRIITDNTAPDEREKGRIFYLSVPPFAYTQIAKRIDSFCRRHEDKQTWFRIVLEKPFGSDLTSAQELAQSLAKYFDENEIYRIDHYLGKTGVSQILQFRFINRDLYRDLWSGDHIERVEIVLKEKNDCKGRTSFYDHYGVIRDVIQNHMTEILAMVAMEMPESLGDRASIMRNKLRLLQEIKPMNSWSGVIGQYRDYRMHYRQENGQDINSNTSTFAAVAMFINNARWHGVPFIMVSGKQLEERTAYVRIVFKDNVHKFHADSAKNDKCSIRQIVFNIQGERLQKPAVLLSGHLPKPKSFHPLILVESKMHKLFGCLVNNFDAFIHSSSADAYTTLISAVYHEQRNLFVGTEDLLYSWKVWSHFLYSLNGVVPRQYDQENLDVLNFVTLGERVEFTSNEDDGICDANGICKSSQTPTNHIYKSELFRRSALVTGTRSQVIRTLADKIVNNALGAVALKGVFHLALSGGTSPIKLYETLAFMSKEFPWQHTHIWLVDERCVPLNSKESNFNLIYEKLFQHVPISPFNIHPMNVMLRGGLCDPGDEGANHYEAELKRFLGREQLDFVILGVGADGHTASLFSHQKILNVTDKWIGLSESGKYNGVKQRMTMTLTLLNKAKTIAVLVLGDQKKDLVKTISSGDVDTWNYPVTGLHPDDGELTWYIDNEALGNH